MVDFRYNFSFFINAVKYGLLPILAVALFVAFLVFRYTRKLKSVDIEKYDYVVELWTTILAIVIICGLFIVTLGFSWSLSHVIKANELVKNNEIIYYLVITTPSIPFCFFVLYIYRVYDIVSEYKQKHKTLENTSTNLSSDAGNAMSAVMEDKPDVLQSNSNVNNEFSIDKLNNSYTEDDKGDIPVLDLTDYDSNVDSTTEVLNLSDTLNIEKSSEDNELVIEEDLEIL